VSLDVMAKTAEPALEVLYPQFYLEGTAQSHANMFGIERRRTAESPTRNI
jgi:hypothetical protein